MSPPPRRAVVAGGGCVVGRGRHVALHCAAAVEAAYDGEHAHDDVGEDGVVGSRGGKAPLLNVVSCTCNV